MKVTLALDGLRKVNYKRIKKFIQLSFTTKFSAAIEIMLFTPKIQNYHLSFYKDK